MPISGYLYTWKREEVGEATAARLFSFSLSDCDVIEVLIIPLFCLEAERRIPLLFPVQFVRTIRSVEIIANSIGAFCYEFFVREEADRRSMALFLLL